MSPLRILFINRWVGYNEGGNETHIKDLLSQFSGHGHKITILTTTGHALDNLAKVNKVYINSAPGYYSYGLLGLFNAIFYLFECFIAFLDLYYLKKARFDLVSVHFSLEGILARIIKILFGIPYVFVLAGDTPLEIIEAKRANGKINISNFMNTQCLKQGFTCEILPKGFDLTRFSPQIDYARYRQKFCSKSTRLILSVCRLDPRKNLITLIEAAHILINKKKEKNLLFLIVGDGVERNFLQGKIHHYHLENYIKMLGFLPNTGEELPRVYAMSDLFVLPTLYEGFGWVYLEAMASGLPIITTNAGSNTEIVGDIGVLVPIKAPKILAEEICKLLNNSVQRKAMSTLGLSRSREFSWEILYPKYEKYYRSISALKITPQEQLSSLGFIFKDIFKILGSLIRDKVILNKTS